MKIAVLCGGLSPERNVSISSGTKIASALAERGHQVVLLDMFLGLEDYDGDIAGIFENPPALGGTKIAELMEFCGGYKEEPKKIIMGGPMMGVAVTSDELPILKQNNGILAFGEREAHLMEPTDCIRCGRCVAACPMHLVPTKLEKYAERKDVAMLKQLDIMTCMECGCCSYSCPANRRIVQAIRLGKFYVKKENAKK